MRKGLIFSIFLLSCLGSVVFADPTEEDQLLVLADQGFQQLHDVYVTNPESERVNDSETVPVRI